MKKFIGLSLAVIFFASASAWALDPVAPRAERRFGLVYVKTPNASDKITLTSLREKGETMKIETGKDMDVRVGEYRVTVDMGYDYIYEQELTVRPTERHEIIVPGYGNLRVNGTKGKIEVYQAGSNALVAEFKGGEIRTLPRGIYDVKIEVGKYTLEQNGIMVVTNTLREIDVQ